MSYYRAHLGLFAMDMTLCILAALADLAFPYATRYALQELLP